MSFRGCLFTRGRLASEPVQPVAIVIPDAIHAQMDEDSGEELEGLSDKCTKVGVWQNFSQDNVHSWD